jgi:hypothetical protein
VTLKSLSASGCQQSKKVFSVAPTRISGTLALSQGAKYAEGLCAQAISALLDSLRDRILRELVVVLSCHTQLETFRDKRGKYSLDTALS